MYAVVSSGGKQYRVEAGSTLTLERLQGEPGEPGASVTFDRVLLIGDGDDVTVGTPVVPGASVSATVLGEALGPKLIIFKFKQKVKYRRRTGHRQHLTRVRIDAINPTAVAVEVPKAKRAARPRVAKAESSNAPAKKAVAKPSAAKKAVQKPTAAKKAVVKPAAAKPKARRAPTEKAAAEE